VQDRPGVLAERGAQAGRPRDFHCDDDPARGPGRKTAELISRRTVERAVHQPGDSGLKKLRTVLGGAFLLRILRRTRILGAGRVFGLVPRGPDCRYLANLFSSHD